VARILSAKGKSYGVTGWDAGSNCLETVAIQVLESSNEVGILNKSIKAKFMHKNFPGNIFINSDIKKLNF